MQQFASSATRNGSAPSPAVVTAAASPPIAHLVEEAPNRRILVVEDTSELATLIATHLREVAREVAVCADGRVALATLQKESVDLVVLDIVLPGLNGLEICRWMRASGISTPILMLTAKCSELDRIVGLEYGADDYMVKPFSMLELLARVKAIFRRVAPRGTAEAAPRAEKIRIADLLLDPAARQVLREGQPISLTEKEFDLLHLFARNPGRVYARSQILDLVWGYGSGVYEYTVTSHINRLRAKIEKDPANPTIIQTVWGIGYRLQAENG
ncbi:MAG: response regulator transcription factor [Pseudomonadota bacterium]|jgi:DNA-binding response OmpR family regulator